MRAFLWIMVALLCCPVRPGAAALPRDPVCNLPVDPQEAYVTYAHRGQDQVFICRRSFEHFLDDPDARDQRLRLRSGWYPWIPYQYAEKVGERTVLSGLDTELLHRAFEDIHMDVEIEPVEWQRHQMEVKRGSRDIAAGAFRTPERERYAFFSHPYRQESDALYLRRGQARTYGFRDIPGMLAAFDAQEFRLGVVKGYAYADPLLNDYITAHSGTGRIIPVNNEEENFDNLFADRIDGFLVDRIVGATIAWRNGWLSDVEEYPHVVATADIHVMFSKASTSPALVRAFNESLAKLRGSGEYNHLVQRYVFPVLLAQTIEKKWFFNIDIVGTIAFAISGLILARRGKYDFFGAILLGALPAIGGGIMRDVLISRRPVGILRTPYYIYAIIITVTVGFVILRLHDRLARRFADHRLFATLDRNVTTHFNKIVQWCDALGLAAFTIIGVVIAVEARCQPLWIWGPVLATITSSGGGILRDLVRGESEISSIKGSFYPVVSVLWGLFLSLVLLWQTTRTNPDEIFAAVLITLFGALGTRLLAMWRKWRTPYF